MSKNEIVVKSGPLKGEIHIPGDKSISHRALLLSALADGPVEINGFLKGADPLETMACLRALGVKIDALSGDKLIVHGISGKFTKPKKPLYVGNSGTTIRILSGILAAQDFECEIAGDASINQRPMKRIVEPLSQMGAQLSGKVEKGQVFPPLKIKGAKLKGIKYKLPIASAQVKSSILLAGLFANGVTEVVEPDQSRDHTERMLKHFGVKIEQTERQIKLAGGQKLKGKTDILVPGDISSAAYLIAAAILVPGSALILRNVGLNPTRIGILEVLRRMGGGVEVLDEELLSEEPRGTLKVTNRKLKGIEIQGSLIPRLIDEIPVIAVLATQAQGDTVIKDARELRVKESDRIATVSGELKKMGVNITPTEDGMIITGGTKLKGTKVKSHGDHRLAMSLSIAGLIAEGKTEIEDTACVETSFPGFFKVLNSVKS
ncbi:MAG: 3-phosphoshikimate 1-carboxyvinyltransferase [Candidatus Margulisbacteria bacterium]|nr:3-phosphoshikimate 1-carboxyvinyltransferase [Candidatus Margulisiibacteriota bacterium]MBU1021720.1 3-phosphoshikimate 1-carboxyvinyltransferase [Candidatus Margulisiibacteriota bacterium]MBU1729466.1 3-phosphoshikimate 1-carboxyvinyltransferase [Candidatus Margulisiibacteriota bacterium]MBU1955433.1 3-phosphoshikimate 1-carboxyvinyltransferase [Candidatus Margulisiibacteriota bacterium]